MLWRSPEKEHDSWLFRLLSFSCIYLLHMCFTLTSPTCNKPQPGALTLSESSARRRNKTFAVFHLSLCSICQSAVCECHLTSTTYAQTQTICGGSDCPVGFICNSFMFACSLLSAALVLPSGWTCLRQVLDLTRAMFSGTRARLILSELFGSQR